MLIDLTQSIYIDQYNAIRRAYFEFQGYENIILFMIQNQMKDTTEFKEYFEEYIEKLANYQIEKEKFTNLLKINNNEFNHWEILFEKDMVQLD